MRLSSIFGKLAEEFTSTGCEYLCNALATMDLPQSQVRKAQEHIASLIAPHTCVESWLIQHVKGIRPTYDDLHAYRIRWCRHMAEELRSQGR